MRITLFSCALLLSTALAGQWVVTPAVGTGFYDYELPGYRVSIDVPLVASLHLGYRFGAFEPTLDVSFQRIRGRLSSEAPDIQLRNNDFFLGGSAIIHLPDSEDDRESFGLVLGAGYLFPADAFDQGVTALRGGAQIRVAAVSLSLTAQASVGSELEETPWLTVLSLGVPLWGGQ